MVYIAVVTDNDYGSLPFPKVMRRSTALDLVVEPTSANLAFQCNVKSWGVTTL